MICVIFYIEGKYVVEIVKLIYKYLFIVYYKYESHYPLLS